MITFMRASHVKGSYLGSKNFVLTVMKWLCKYNLLKLKASANGQNCLLKAVTLKSKQHKILIKESDAPSKTHIMW